MMVSTLIAQPVLHDYSHYIAGAYGLAAVLLAGLVVQSILSSRKIKKTLEGLESEMTKDGTNGHDDNG